jgi:N-carbamoyl-L-amino-acid hydrolase
MRSVSGRTGRRGGVRTAVLWAALLVPVVATGEGGERTLSRPDVNPERIKARLEALAEAGRTPEGGVSRVAFSEADILGRDIIMKMMRETGLSVRVDTAGNIIGRREGSVPGLRPIVIGSHADSVPNGGKYDGALGVVAGLECASVLRETGLVTRHPLEVVIFTDEEGGLIGSRAMAGRLAAKDLAAVSQSDKTIAEGIAVLGGNPAKLSEAARKAGEIAAYFEVHIEQGGTLEASGLPVGVVTGIVGIGRWEITIEGQSNHAGTTPMDQRRDALLAAAHLVVEVNRTVTGTPGRQVGTVGRMRVEPGAVNVIPGKVVMSLELRDLEEAKIRDLITRIRGAARTIAGRTGTRIGFAALEELTPPAATDPRLREAIEAAAGELGLETMRLPSGAGHDAQSIAAIAPVAMIFVPSVGGISHSPFEYSRPDDIAAGTRVLLRALFIVDSR